MLGLTIGLLRYRDGKLPSIHRSMMNMNERSIGLSISGVVSRAHLPRVLQKGNLWGFGQLLFERFKLELKPEEKQWLAGGGKELRGSIEKGNKRGEVLVQLVRHRDGEILNQKRHNGTKESERPCLQDLLSQSGALNQNITADALHLCPTMTQLIAQAGGVF